MRESLNHDVMENIIFYRILPGNFEKLLMLVFDGIPESEHSVRFHDLDLSQHRPLQPR